MADDNSLVCMAPDVADVALPAVDHALEPTSQLLPAEANPAGAFGIVTGPLGMATGAHEFSEGVEHGDVAKALQGGLGTLAGTASTLEGAGTIAAYALGGGAASETAGSIAVAGGTAAPVLAAGATGLAIGTGMANVADGNYTKTGLWGQGGDGKNLSAMDWGASWGTKYDQMMGNTGPSIGGGIASGLGGIAGGIAGFGQAAYHYLNGEKM